MNLSAEKKYRIVLFDLDGTLTNPEEGISKSINYALEKMGVPKMEDLKKFIGQPLQNIFKKITKQSDDLFLNELIEHYRKRYFETGMYENYIYDGVEEMLLKLNQEGYRLFIATTKPQSLACQIVAHFKIAHYFESIHGSELDGTLSDKIHLLKHIIESQKIKEPMLMVGDRKFDMIAAIQNGIDSLGVTYGFGSVKELIKAKARYLCHSPQQVYQWINS